MGTEVTGLVCAKMRHGIQDALVSLSIVTMMLD